MLTRFTLATVLGTTSLAAWGMSPVEECEGRDECVVQLEVQHTGFCLDVNGASLQPNASVIQYSCGRGPHQTFAVVPSAREGEVSLRAVHSDLCVAVAGLSNQAGGYLVQWFCDDQPNQTFVPEALGDGIYMLRAAHSGYCLAVEGGFPDLSARFVQWPCLSYPNFTFALKVVEQ